MVLKLDKRSGAWYRPKDKLITDEAPTVYGNVPVREGATVLDLGAHIGVVSRMFMAKGAARTIAVEADPDNVPLLRRNLRGLKSIVYPAAVGNKVGQAAFFTRPDRSYVGTVLPLDPSRKRLQVAVLPFSGLLAQYRPDLLKVDIEFAEYGLPELRALPDYVRTLAMEVHIRFIGIFTGVEQTPLELTERRRAAADLIASFQAQGFTEHWRQDKQAKPGEPAALPDDTGLGAMTKCVCATWVR